MCRRFPSVSYPRPPRPPGPLRQPLSVYCSRMTEIQMGKKKDEKKSDTETPGLFDTEANVQRDRRTTEEGPRSWKRCSLFLQLEPTLEPFSLPVPRFSTVALNLLRSLPLSLLRVRAATIRAPVLRPSPLLRPTPARTRLQSDCNPLNERRRVAARRKMYWE